MQPSFCKLCLAVMQFSSANTNHTVAKKAARFYQQAAYLPFYGKITSREKASVIKLEVAPRNRTIVVDVPYAVYLGRETGGKYELVRVISVVYL